MIQTKETDGLPKYAEYKESGVEWLGEIPIDWNVQKLKFLGSLYSGLSGKTGNDFEKNFKEGFKMFIPFTNIYNNLTISEGELQYVKIKDGEIQNKVEKYDVLFLMSSETLEDIGKCAIYVSDLNELYLNSFCKGFRIRQKSVFSFYLNYLLQSNTYRNYFSIVGRGFTRINIKQEYINDLGIPIPPLPEQTAIANFLDDKTTKIDKGIAQKEKLIVLLNERKQILIQQAVTKGLDPAVKMKNSGVDWIGEIPEHWDLVANRILFSERKEPGREGLPLLSVSIHTAVSSQELNEEDNIQGRIKIEDKSSYKYVDVHDIVFNMMRAWQGAIGAVSVEGMVSPAYVVAKPKAKLFSLFFEYLYRTASFIQQMSRNSKGITDFRKRLYWDEFKQLKTILPPKDEQELIVQFIEKQSLKIDQSITLQQTQIEKLKEYKSVLIDNVVTGKIKIN